MWPNVQLCLDLATLAEKILNRKLHLLCSDSSVSFIKQSLKEMRSLYFCVTPKNHRLMFVTLKT